MSLEAIAKQLPPEAQARLRELAAAYEEAVAYNRLDHFYPDAGPLRRELYRKHLEFFGAGAKFNERAFLGGNRSGKTTAGAYETTLHLTGLYPDWWTGKRFKSRVRMFAAGDTSKTVRDIMQVALLGEHGRHGTGMIPARLLSSTTPKAGVPDAIESVYVKHVSGGDSWLQFKSYDQRRESFQGTAQHAIWLDEECPMDIYTESLLRTMTTNGILYLTFTPLRGLTDVVRSFFPDGTGLAVASQ